MLYKLESGKLIECKKEEAVLQDYAPGKLLTISSGWALTIMAFIAVICLICLLQINAVSGKVERLDKRVEKFQYPFEHFVITYPGSKKPDLIFDVDPNSGQCVIFGEKKVGGE